MRPNPSTSRRNSGTRRIGTDRSSLDFQISPVCRHSEKRIFNIRRHLLTNAHPQSARAAKIDKRTLRSRTTIFRIRHQPHAGDSRSSGLTIP
jgi:hypothetical protein